MTFPETITDLDLENLRQARLREVATRCVAFLRERGLDWPCPEAALDAVLIAVARSTPAFQSHPVPPQGCSPLDVYHMRYAVMVAEAVVATNEVRSTLGAQGYQAERSRIHGSLVAAFMSGGRWTFPWTSLVAAEFPGALVDVATARRIKRDIRNVQSLIGRHIRDAVGHFDGLRTVLNQHGYAVGEDDELALMRLSIVAAHTQSLADHDAEAARFAALEAIGCASDPRHPAWKTILDTYFPLP